MVTAVVLIKAETDKVPELAERLAELDGVSEVFSVAGQYDLVALVRVRENEDLARVISERCASSRHHELRDPDRVQGLFEAGPRGGLRARARLISAPLCGRSADSR